MQTIVIGHKNPDMDSICSALAYARLKQLLGTPDVVAARAGNTNARIDYVLTRFGVEAPVFLSDVAPVVSDVMQRDGASVRSDSAVYDAIQLIDDKQLRGLPVVDENRRCVGLLSTFKLNRHLFPPREEAANARVITASLVDIVETFGGSVVTGGISAESGDYLLMVGAMSQESFSHRLQGHDARQIVLFVGDRDQIQLCAIRAKVRAVVITGGFAASAPVEQAAGEAGVVIISSPHDTATTVLLARGAVRVGRMVEDFTSFTPDTPLEIARERAAGSASFVFPIIGDDGVLAGVLSKSDFIKPIPRKLILVDHNELSQAVAGADKIPIVEILDHHRIGGFSTETPIHFWNNPVGSTSTIVGLCYEQMGVPVPLDVAGLLMAGIIADTLNLSSPTTTPIDKRLLARLSDMTRVDPFELAGQIFSVGSPLLTMPADHVITIDCKEYEESGHRFTVSQIEELNFSHFEDKRAALIEALDRHQRRLGLVFAALLVTDINTQNSLLLVCGAPGFLTRITFPTHRAHVWELAGIVSRKKQLLPYLLECLSGVAAAPPSA
ncbi:MAG: putative manganese-dependent inorganic diphosphatase [Limisphaerales bacterium]